MLSMVRAGVAAAMLLVTPLILAPLAANAADKPFQNKDLADSAITLEAQIKSDAGTQTKPVAQVRRDADAAFSRNDFRAGMALLGQIVAAAPNDSTTWLRLARAIMQIKPADDKERKLLLERASTAAYIAYQRTTNRDRGGGQPRTSRQCAGPPRRVAAGARSVAVSLELREVAESAANTRGCANSTASACSITASMPTRLRRGPASSSRRTCRSVPTSRRSSQLPAPTSRRYRPPRSSFASRACARRKLHRHVARRTAVGGARDAVEIGGFCGLCARPEALGALCYDGLRAAAHRSARHSGDQHQHPRDRGRDLPHRRPQSHRYHRRPTITTAAIFSAVSAVTRSSSSGRLAASRCGRASWRSKSPPLNADVTTAFPVDQAVGELKPGVYIMVAQPQETKRRQQLRFAGDAMVHRFRSRPYRIFRQ